MTGLSHRICCHLVENLQYSKSLLALHIGFNPGTSTDFDRVVRLRLKVKNPQ